MIPQMIPYFDEAEAIEIQNYMASGGFLTEYKKTSELESLIADFTGSTHAIMVSNGTVSLIMMLLALDIGPGDEVIVPNYTMIATPNAVVAVGAKPVFIDVEPSTLCLDIDRVSEAINYSTKAIFFVAANGRHPTYEIEELSDLCANKGVYLLEDAAQGLGSTYTSGDHVGTVGLLGSLSFSVPKIITTGQGGCILTRDDSLAARLRKIKDFGRSRGGIDIHDTIGFNYKYTDLQACVGIAQMRKLKERVERKKQILKTYQERLSAVQGIQIFENDMKHTSPWFIDALVESRDGLISHLDDSGIGSRAMYPPINAQRAYGIPGDFPVSEMVGRAGLWLPSFVQITDDEIDQVCNSITKFYL